MLILSCNQNSEYNRFETWTQDQPHHFCINNILSSSFNPFHITMHVSQGSGGYRRYHTGSCGGYRYAESGLIHTPGYPDELYENGLTCSWYIRVKSGQRIRLEFIDKVELESYNNTCRDYVRVSVTQYLQLSSWLNRGLKRIDQQYDMTQNIGQSKKQTTSKPLISDRLQSKPHNSMKLHTRQI